MCRAVETRNLYRFEATVPVPARLRRCTSMRALRALAAYVWAREKPHQRQPRIVAGRGELFNGRRVSYVLACSYMQLARHERNVMVLLHELTHCLGYTTHGQRFVRVYFRLLVQYGGLDEGQLLLNARLMGVRL